MQVAPPSVASNCSAQKLSEPEPSVNVQHLFAPVSVQSAGFSQRRTVWSPVQEVPSDVVHCAPGVQATWMGSDVQLGMVPPVRWMWPQHTLAEQSSGPWQAKPASPPEEPLLLALPEELPLLLAPPDELPLLLPLELPLEEPELLAVPLLLPLLLPPPLLLPEPPPLLLEVDASPPPPGGLVDEPLQATSSATTATTETGRVLMGGISSGRVSRWSSPTLPASLNASQTARPFVPENLRRGSIAGQVHVMRPVASAALATLSFVLLACGGATPGPSASAATAKATPAPAAKGAPVADHRLPRSAVRDAVAQGLGSFLQHLDLSEQPVFVAGKFHGFRIAALHDEGFWQGVDIKPGDVVVSVNGFPIERPEQAQTAFESLDVASELHVAYERDGQPRDLVYAIVDDR
jgi:hypothetical protein